MFECHEPVLRLTESDQQLLAAALGRQTDEQLSIQLDLSLAAVKKRWVSIFSKIADARPDLLEGLEPVSESGRGRQKRHHVLSYI